MSVVLSLTALSFGCAFHVFTVSIDSAAPAVMPAGLLIRIQPLQRVLPSQRVESLSTGPTFATNPNISNLNRFPNILSPKYFQTSY